MSGNVIIADQLPRFERLIFNENIRDLHKLNKRSILRQVSKLYFERCESIYNEVFEKITLDKAKNIAKNFVEASSGSSVDLMSPLTYGEIQFSSFIHIIQLCNPTKGNTFVDLGHGTGKALVATFLVFSELFNSINGIEIIPGLFEESIQSIKTLKDIVLNDPRCSGAFCDEVIINPTLGDIFTNPTDANFDWLGAGDFPRA